MLIQTPQGFSVAWKLGLLVSKEAEVCYTRGEHVGRGPLMALSTCGNWNLKTTPSLAGMLFSKEKRSQTVVVRPIA